MFLEVKRGSIFVGSIAQCEEMGDVFGEPGAPLATKSGYSRRKDFEIGCGELFREFRK